MGFVLQRQRYGIEAFRGQLEGVWSKEAFAMVPEGYDLSFYVCEYSNPKIGCRHSVVCSGISEGYGTCSLIHGMNVAVFDENKTGRYEPLRSDCWPEIVNCEYAVLNWPRRIVLANLSIQVEGTGRVAPDISNPFKSQRVVELLKMDHFKHHNWDTPKKSNRSTMIYFVRTGLISVYVPM